MFNNIKVQSLKDDRGVLAHALSGPRNENGKRNHSYSIVCWCGYLIQIYTGSLFSFMLYN